MLLFVVNFVITAIYFQVVPQKGLVMALPTTDASGRPRKLGSPAAAGDARRARRPAAASTSGRSAGPRARSAATRRRSCGCSPRSPSAPARSRSSAARSASSPSCRFFTGTEVGLQGYASLDQLGIAAFTGFISAYFNTREIAPLVAGARAAATVGCGFTAQLGAMRISEEIDALEVMGVPVAAVPGDDPDDRRLHRRHPALRRRAARVATSRPRLIATLLLRPVGRHLRPLLPPVPAAAATCSGRSSRCWSSRS